MAFDPITAVLNVGNTLIDRLIPDKTASAAAKAQLLQMQVQGEFAQLTGQMEINKVEAASNSVFVAGWRPFVGWVCGIAFAYAFVLHPMVLTILAASGVKVNVEMLPKLDMSEMMPVLLGMLGLGALRSYDKTQATGNGH